MHDGNLSLGPGAYPSPRPPPHTNTQARLPEDMLVLPVADLAYPPIAASLQVRSHTS